MDAVGPGQNEPEEVFGVERPSLEMTVSESLGLLLDLKEVVVTIIIRLIR